MPEDKDNETLISHLEALRETLLKCFISMGLILPFAFFIAPKALNMLIKIIIGESSVMLNYFSPIEVFIIQIKLALVIDFIVCFPYIAKQIWNFLLPALYDNERKIIKSVVLISSMLFALGVLFCIFIILPWIIKFGVSFSTSNIQAVFGISNIITTALWLSVAFGFMFQMPLITYYLIKSGIISYDSVCEKRRYVIVILLFVAAILTPPDVISQIMLFISTYCLFEAGLFFARKYNSQDKNNS